MLNNQSNNLKIIFLFINKFKLISMAKTVVPNVNVVKTKMRKKICIIFIDFFLIFSLGDAREDIIKYVYIS